jgi:hypothetical protein
MHFVLRRDGPIVLTLTFEPYPEEGGALTRGRSNWRPLMSISEPGASSGWKSEPLMQLSRVHSCPSSLPSGTFRMARNGLGVWPSSMRTVMHYPYSPTPQCEGFLRCLFGLLQMPPASTTRRHANIRKEMRALLNMAASTPETALAVEPLTRLSEDSIRVHLSFLWNGQEWPHVLRTVMHC